MDLVAHDLQARGRVDGGGAGEGFFGGHDRDGPSSPSPGAAPAADSRASGSRISRPSIWNPPQMPTTSVSPSRRQLADPVGQPVLAEVAQVGQRVLAAGNQDGVGLLQVGRRADDPQPHVALAAEGVQIGEVGDVRQVDHGDFHASSPLTRRVGRCMPSRPTARS